MTHMFMYPPSDQLIETRRANEFNLKAYEAKEDRERERYRTYLTHVAHNEELAEKTLEILQDIKHAVGWK